MALITATYTRTVTVAGANLFRLAAQYLNDATQWNRIAQLNGLSDPVVLGTITLKIPPMGPGNGGVLGA